MRLISLLFCAAAAFAQTYPVEFIPPHSKVVIGIDLRRIKEAVQLPANLPPETQGLASLMLAQNGLSHLNPLTDVDSILIATSGEGENPPALAVIRGRFASLKLTEQKNAKGVLMLADDSTLLAGDAAEVRAALDRKQHPAAADSAFLARINSLAARFDAWGLGEQSGGFAAAKGQAGGLDGVDRFQFGASFHKGLALEAEAHMKSAQDAQRLSQSLKFFEAMLAGQKTSPDGSKFNLSTQNGTLKIALFVPQEQLKKAMDAQKAGFAAALQPKPQAAPRPKTDPNGRIVTNGAGETVGLILPGGAQ